MRKLFVLTHKMSAGGCERVIAQLLHSFCADDMDCTLITECSVPSFYPLPKSLRVLSLSDKPVLRAREIPAAYGKLRRLVKKEKPDLVLAMPEKVNVWAALFLLGAGVPLVVSERNDPYRHPANRLKRALRKLTYPLVNGFVFQTTAAANYFGRAIRARGVVLDNPLDVSSIPAPYTGERKKRIVSVGRLEAQKNFPLLINAFARFYRTHPDYSLVIYGSGALIEELGKLANKRGVSRAVELAGQKADVPQQIADSKMFVLCSDYEGMPNALIEAMASGLCCVATDCPIYGVRSLIQNEENGLLVPVGDEDALANAMTRLADDENLARRLGKNAEQIKARLDARVVCEQWRQYLAKIADGK